MANKMWQIFDQRGQTDPKIVIQIMAFALLGIAVILAIIYFVFLIYESKQLAVVHRDADQQKIVSNANRQVIENLNVSKSDADIKDKVVERSLEIDPQSIDDINGGLGPRELDIGYNWFEKNLPKDLQIGDVLVFTYDDGNIKATSFATLAQNHNAGFYYCQVPWQVNIPIYTRKDYYKIYKVTDDQDSDSDGLTDLKELSEYKTDPYNPDTDGDSYHDGHEVEQGYSPTEAFKWITILEPQAEIVDTKQTRHEISGVCTDDVTKIRVIYQNKGRGFYDDYYLVNFMPGDTIWKYTADTRYQNLAQGKNEYKVMAYNNNKLLSEDSIVLNLTELPGQDEIIDVDWVSEPLKIRDDDNSYIENHKVGKVLNGNYQGLDLYLEVEYGMGVSFDHFVMSNEQKVSFDKNNIRITDLEKIPERIKLPGSDYELVKMYSSAIFNNSDDMKKLFDNEILGPVYLRGDCIIAELPDHREISYQFGPDFYDDERVVNITFTDGTKNKDTYISTERGGCGYYCNSWAIVTEEDLRPDERLKVAGTASNGEKLYEFKDKNDGYYWNLYNNKMTLAYYDNGPLEGNKYTFNEFIASHPVLYWHDPLGRWIRFKNSKYDIMAEMCKPVIYLYPEKTAKISLKVTPNGGFTYTEPKYNGGWQVIADPRGKIIDQASGLEYEYLFWEGIGLNYGGTGQGFVVKKEELSKFFDEKLYILGLRGKEIDDFKEYWVNRLLDKPYYLVDFIAPAVFNDVAPLEVYPKPDSIIRVMMHAHPLDAPISIAEQKLKSPRREKFTVVEWGGAVVK